MKTALTAKIAPRTTFDPSLAQPSVPAGSVALYWDFENLHASLCEARHEGTYRQSDNRFKVQEPLVNVPAVVALASSLGPLAIHRAY